MTDFTTWTMDNDDRLYRFWTKVNDESMCNYGYIAEVVELGAGDVLIGFQVVDGGEVIENHLEFYRLSDITLEWWADDKQGLFEDENEDA